MRQRNDTGHVQDVADFPTDERPDARPFTVGPGEVVDFPELLAGFTETEPAPLGGDEETGAPDAADPQPAKPRSKRATVAPTPEGADQ